MDQQNAILIYYKYHYGNQLNQNILNSYGFKFRLKKKNNYIYNTIYDIESLLIRKKT